MVLETKKQLPEISGNCLIGKPLLMAHPERFELPTKWFEATYSIQLSYGCVRGAII